jgi:hypothetical protein
MSKEDPSGTADLIEGGSYKCFIHPTDDGKPYETESTSEWDKHCIDTGHKQIGTAPCIYCGKKVEGEFKYKGRDKPVGAVCDECKEEYLK